VVWGSLKTERKKILVTFKFGGGTGLQTNLYNCRHVSWQVDLVRVDLAAIDLVRIDLVAPSRTLHQIM